MYGLLLLLTALSLWLLDVVLTHPRRAAALALTLTASLMLYTHYYAALVLADPGDDLPRTFDDVLPDDGRDVDRRHVVDGEQRVTEVA